MEKKKKEKEKRLRYFFLKYKPKIIVNYSPLSTCDRMIGPPWVSNNFSAFNMSTIFVTHFCISSFIAIQLQIKLSKKKRLSKKMIKYNGIPII